jgi:hypothetical protein
VLEPANARLDKQLEIKRRVFRPVPTIYFEDVCLTIFQLYDAAMWQGALALGGDKIAHIYIGMAIWLAIAIILRQPLSDVRPLLVLGLLEVLNEIFDWLAKGAWRWSDTSTDLFNSLFWPLAIVACLRTFTFLGRRVSAQ